MGRVLGVSMRRKSEAGQALVFAVLALGILLMGFAGLGIDLGYLRYQKRLQQTAADAAAMSGAGQLLYGSGVSAAALHDAASNGFADTSGNSGCPSAVNCVTVTVNNPPLSGPHSGDSNFVEVYVEQIQPTFFMRVLGINSESISARAVATNASANGCLYTVGKSGNGILLTGFLEGIAANNCSIMDDANLTVSAFLASVAASSIGVGGTYTAGFGTVTPAPVTGVVGGYDPLAYLTSPSTSGACQPDPNVTASGFGPPVTINPGHYCTGITITGSRNVVFNPGVYTITGANSSGYAFQATGGGNLTGTGVMFYNTVGTLAIGNGSTINLTAPTASNSVTGAVAGILFWQAVGDTTNVNLFGNLFSSISGIIYAPGALLNIPTGGAISAGPYTILVVKSVQLNGLDALNLSANTSSLAGGSPIKSVTLVE